MIGTNLKNYLIEAELGRGGMGVVYRARDTKLGRRVALKVLPPELVRNEERRRRFVQEARAASAVNHPAIAQIYEIEEEGDHTFIVMEYVDGSTVRQLVARGELDVPAAIEVGIQVADALARAHEAGIVHRDIKSDNIMVTTDGHPKILDFGLAKLLDLSASDPDAMRAETIALTQTGMVVGTVAYMSPEQARGLPADRRSDIFSFGVVLYEMATAQLPFQGQSALDTMHAIAFGETRPITTLRAGLPFSLQRIVDRCLQKRPEDRYPDMRAVAADLRLVRRELESGASGRQPFLDRARYWVRGLNARGSIWIAVISFAFGAMIFGILTSPERDRFGSLIPLGIFAIIIWRIVRDRGHKAVTKFARRAGKLPEVRLVSSQDRRITVVVHRPTAKTYLKLNAFLAQANGSLWRGTPFTLHVIESLSDEDRKSILATSALHYADDEI